MGWQAMPVVGTFALVGKLPEKPAQLDPLRALWNPEHPGDIGVTRLQQGLLWPLSRPRQPGGPEVVCGGVANPAALVFAYGGHRASSMGSLTNFLIRKKRKISR